MDDQTKPKEGWLYVWTDWADRSPCLSKSGSHLPRWLDEREVCLNWSFPRWGTALSPCEAGAGSKEACPLVIAISSHKTLGALSARLQTHPPVAEQVVPDFTHIYIYTHTHASTYA